MDEALSSFSSSDSPSSSTVGADNDSYRVMAESVSIKELYGTVVHLYMYHATRKIALFSNLITCNAKFVKLKLCCTL